MDPFRRLQRCPVVRGHAPPMQAVLIRREGGSRVRHSIKTAPAPAPAHFGRQSSIHTSSQLCLFLGRVEVGRKLSSKQAGVVDDQEMLGAWNAGPGPLAGPAPAQPQPPSRQLSFVWGPRCCVTASPERSLAIRSRHCAGQFPPASSVRTSHQPPQFERSQLQTCAARPVRTSNRIKREAVLAERSETIKIYRPSALGSHQETL